MNEIFAKYDMMINNLMVEGIYDLNSLQTSHYFEEFFLATTDVARYIVYNNTKYVVPICKKEFKEFDDVVSEVTILFLAKYDSQVKAIINSKDAHNHNAYLNQIFYNNYVCDSSRKKALKETKTHTDENGKKHTVTKVKTVKGADGKDHKVYASHVSSSRPVSDDDDITLEDRLVARSLPVDHCFLAREMDYEYNKRLVDDMKKLADHKYIAQLYVYIADALEAHGYESSLDKAVAIFNRTDIPNELKIKLFLKVYHKDLLEFVSHLDNKVISTETHEFFLGLCTKDINRFGRNFKLTNDKIYHLRDYNNKDLGIKKEKAPH